MKKISEHLGEIIVALAGVALLITAIMLFKAPIGGFFDRIVEKETNIGNEILTGIENIDLGNLGSNGGGASNSEPSEVTHYTTEEIAANELLFAIGATNENYVVAAFSEDRSTVTITKNGDDSDGLMRDFTSSGDSPIVEVNTMYSVYNVIFKEGVVNVGAYLCFECYELSGITLCDSITSIGKYAFKDCQNLVSLTLPTNLKTIGESAFEGTYVYEVTFPASVETIGKYAFRNCYNLMMVYIPANVTSIGSDSFKSMASGSYIYCETETIKDMLRTNYTSYETTCVVDPSKFAA